MNMIPWRKNVETALSPFDEVWNRFFNGEGFREFGSHLPEVFKKTVFPAVNVAESEDGFTITMDAPGLAEDDFEVETMGNHLLISGERKWEEEKKEKEFHRIESQYGKFARTVELPGNMELDPKKIEANYRKGVLTIRVPKKEKTPAAKIKVHAG